MNANGATYVHPAAGLQTQLTSDAAARVTKMGDDVKALSTTLAALTPGNSALADFNAASHTLTLNAASGSAGYAVFNIDGALLSSSTYTELVYNFASTSLPVIVNVSASRSTSTSIRPARAPRTTSRSSGTSSRRRTSTSRRCCMARFSRPMPS